MSILGPDGNPVSTARKWIPAADRYSRSLPWEPNRLDDFDSLVPQNDLRTICSVSKRLFVRSGLVRGACVQRATYSVGSHWLPVFKGTDQNWGREAEQLLIEEWFGFNDIKGPMHDWHSQLKVDSLSMDREGDFGILLLEGSYPRTQRVGAHKIGTRNGEKEVRKGKYRGAEIINGVIVDKYKTPIAYRLLGADERDDVDVPADSFIHVFDPNWHEQQRGLPIFVHALNDLRSGIYSQNWELLAQMIVSSIALIEYNDYGEPEGGDPTVEFGGAGGAHDPDSSPMYKQMYGGMLRYFRSNSGGKLEQIKHERPGDMWESLQDRMARAALAGVPWPYSMVWKTSDLTSVTQRAELLKAQNAIRERQQTIHKYAKRLVGWAISKFVKMGRLKPNDEWYKWGFTTPPKLSIDPGKDAIANQMDYAMGLVNLDTLVGERTGESLERHLRARGQHVILKQKIAEELTAESGGKYVVTVEDLGKEPSAAGASPPAKKEEKQSPPSKTDDEEEETEEEEDDK